MENQLEQGQPPLENTSKQAVSQVSKTDFVAKKWGLFNQFMNETHPMVKQTYLSLIGCVDQEQYDENVRQYATFGSGLTYVPTTQYQLPEAEVDLCARLAKIESELTAIRERITEDTRGRETGLATNTDSIIEDEVAEIRAELEDKLEKEREAKTSAGKLAEQLKAENNKLSTTVAMLGDDFKKLELESHAAKSKLQHAEAELKAMSTKLQTERQNAVNLQSLVDDLNERVHSASDRLGREVTRREQLEKQILEAKNKNVDRQELERLDTELTNMKELIMKEHTRMQIVLKENNELRVQTIELQSARAKDRDTIQKDLESARNELLAAKKTCAQHHGKITSLEADLNEWAGGLEMAY